MGPTKLYPLLDFSLHECGASPSVTAMPTRRRCRRTDETVVQTRPVVRIRIRCVVIRIRVRDTAIRIRIVVTPIEHTVLGDSALNFCKGNLFFSDICQNQKKSTATGGIYHLQRVDFSDLRFTLYETSLAALYLATLDALTIFPRKARRDP